MPGTEVESPNRPSDLWGWTLAASLGLLSLSMPQLFRVEGDEATRLLISLAGLFFSGAIVGALCSRRVWRWPIAILVAIMLADLVRAYRDPALGGKIEFGAIMTVMAQHAPDYLLYAMPAAAGAFIGGSLMREGLR